MGDKDEAILGRKDLPRRDSDIKRDFTAIKYSSSMASLYTVDSSITNINEPKLIHCVCEYFRSKMQLADIEIARMKNDKFEAFNELKYPMNTTPEDNEDVLSYPKTVTIEEFANAVYTTGQMSAESLVLAVGYLNRLIEKSKFKLYTFNWRRVLFSTFILSSKVWEDASVWNEDFGPLASSKDMNLLEVMLLELLEYNVTMTGSEYASIYFNLRALDRSSNTTNFKDMKPLDKEGLLKIQNKTEKFMKTKTESQKIRLVRSEEFLKYTTKSQSFG